MLAEQPPAPIIDPATGQARIRERSCIRFGTGAGLQRSWADAGQMDGGVRGAPIRS